MNINKVKLLDGIPLKKVRKNLESNEIKHEEQKLEESKKIEEIENLEKNAPELVIDDKKMKDDIAEKLKAHNALKKLKQKIIKIAKAEGISL